MPDYLQVVDPHEPANPAIAPQSSNQQDAQGVLSRQSLAKDVAEFHRWGLNRKRFRDLTAEKYMLHVDGEGDSQWADLYNGERVVIPFSLSGSPRAQHNLLRPMIDNMVAYHTTMPFRFAVDAKQDREARESALFDQAFANYVSAEQRWNALFAEAMYMAGVYGNCPVHAFWRDDLQSDPYQPVYNQMTQVLEMLEQMGLPPMMPRRGMIDCWVGDPWDTVYDTGATRRSLHRTTYGRTLPGQLVRDAFGHVPGIEAVEGSEKLPSRSRFQRTARKWLQSGNSIHGTSAIYSGYGGDELLALVCQEIAPGIEAEWPAGRLTVIALPGAATTDTADAQSTAVGGYSKPVLLHDGPLPGETFSATRVYSSNRFDDILGKPYVGDLDDLQVQLNQLETFVNEFVRRSTRAPLVNYGGIDVDTAHYDDDAIIEAEPMPGGGNHPLYYLELPARHLSILENKINRVQDAMFRIGGWQAASRGEGHAGDAAAKVVALAQADDTIHGPTNQRFQESVSELAGICWRLMKQYGDVPWIIDIVGEEHQHLADAYLSREELSDRPPQYKLVSGFGATTEAKAQQLMDLLSMTDPLGQPILTAQQFKAAWPDSSVWPHEQDPDEVRQRRPNVINSRIRDAARQFREQQGIPEEAEIPIQHPLVEQAAFQILMMIDQRFPILMDDDIATHLNVLSMITQEETEDVIARRVAMLRQDMLFQWLAERQQAQQEAQEGGDEGKGGGGQRRESRGARSEPGGTQTSEGMKQVGAQTVPELTQQATQGVA